MVCIGSRRGVRRTLSTILGGLAAGLVLSLAGPASAASASGDKGTLDPHQARSLSPEASESEGMVTAMSHENPCNPCGAKNPCGGNPCNPCGGKNPCGANPCNPCGGKNPCGANPCNPCAGKNPCGANPCNPCGGMNPCGMNPCGGNPCGGASVDPGRFQQPAGVELAGGDRRELIRQGEQLWKDRELGKSGIACATCHTGNYGQMGATFAKPYPHRVPMVHQQAGVDQVNAAEMVNFCMIVPMGSDPLSWDSQELAALTAYVEHIQEGFEPPAAANACNPCSMNPCGGNPCNPCSMKRNPCGGY